MVNDFKALLIKFLHGVFLAHISNFPLRINQPRVKGNRIVF